MSDNKVTIDQLDNSAIEAMAGSIGDVNMLNTENKTIVGAITEIVGKKVIADAIGEPLAETDKFTEMGSEINGLLSTFKTNMMNAGVVVESGDKFKALIEKIKGLTEGEGNKGILYTKTNFTISDTPITFETHSSNYENNQNYQQFLPATVSLDFNPTVYIVNLTSKKQLENGNYRLYEEFHIYDTTEPYDGDIWDYCHVSYGDFTADNEIVRESSWSWYDNIKNNIENNMITFPIISSHEFADGTLTTFDEVLYSVFYAIGVGEEDDTLRDSLADILENKGVDVTEEDDMASLISKVSTVSSTLSAGDTRILASNSGYSWNLSGSTKAIQTYYIILPGTVKITCEESFNNSGLKTNNYISVKDNISGTTQKLSCNSSTGSYIFDNITVTSDTTITYYVGNSEFNYVITISADIN